MQESTISTVLGFLVIVVVGLLVVNYFRNLDTGNPTLDGGNTEDLANAGSYTVQAGDTLWSISESVYGSGYNWVDIKEANNLADPNDIEEGQVLVIPALDSGLGDMLADNETEPESDEAVEQDEPIETPMVTAEPEPTAVADQGQIADDDGVVVEMPEVAGAAIGTSYTVVRGDNLWDIAVEAYGDGYRWVDIAEANDLANPQIIHAGNILIIPA